MKAEIVYFYESSIYLKFSSESYSKVILYDIILTTLNSFVIYLLQAATHVDGIVVG